MSFCHETVHQEIRPSTARVLVTELSGTGYNPTPATKPCDNSKSALELSYLSREMLELLSGTKDLSRVTSLEICVDTQENTLGNFGVYLPRLVHLRMNNSIIKSVRDLGTTLSHLQVLWMTRCSLQDLDGISTLSSLKELYAAYNSVSELSQVGMLENLRLLDLEGNDVNDLVQVQYLGLCSRLQTLTLEGNPVCACPNPTNIQTADYNYRAVVRELVPQLRYLDNLRVEQDGCHCSGTTGDDWVILQNAIRDCNSSQTATEDKEKANSTCPDSRTASSRQPLTNHSIVWPHLLADSRPHTSSRPTMATRPGVLSPPGSRPGSADSDLPTHERETSTLTHGAGKILLCGNPIQALRARREKLRTAPTRSTFSPRDPPIHVPEHTYDTEEPDVRKRADVFAELRAWRLQHNRYLQAIEKERSPQVLAIQYSDEGEGEDYYEEDFGGVRSGSSDEGHGEEKQGDTQDPASPYSSSEFLSLDLHHKESFLHDISRLSRSPETVLGPSPPLKISGATTRNLPRIRLRRLPLGMTSSEHLPDFSGVSCSSSTGKVLGGAVVTHGKVHQLNGADVPLLSQPVHIPHPPPMRRILDSCAEMDPTIVQSAKHHPHAPQASKVQATTAITRPRTARAALQKHHPHRLQQPCRGSPQTK